MTPQQHYDLGVFLVDYAPELAIVVTVLLFPLIRKGSRALLAKCFSKNNDK